jgi:hypothetical protein
MTDFSQDYQSGHPAGAENYPASGVSGPTAEEINRAGVQALHDAGVTVRATTESQDAADVLSSDARYATGKHVPLPGGVHQAGEH